MDEAQGKITAKTPALRRTQILLFILGLGVYSYFLVIHFTLVVRMEGL